MPKLISIHEYDLKPEVDTADFERAIRDAEGRGLLHLPGLVAHHLVKGVKGERSGAYAAIWVYESQEAWEQIWGPRAHPRRYPTTLKIGRFGNVRFWRRSWFRTPTLSDSRLMSNFRHPTTPPSGEKDLQ